MDVSRFDRLTRVLVGMRSRRRMLAALATGLVGFTANDWPVRAGPGCKNVGRQCKRARQCCSGICQGKKGKKRCKAHDTGGCQAGNQTTSCGGNTVSCTTSADHDGSCATTTGNAGYCFASGLVCTTCRNDADCKAVCGEAGACIRCPEGCGAADTACVGPADCE